MELHSYRQATRNVSPHEFENGHNTNPRNDSADDIASCLRLAQSQPEAARVNPENFIFFIAHMYHLFGQKDGTEPWSIDKNWDFEIGRRNGVFGAIETHS